MATEDQTHSPLTVESTPLLVDATAAAALCGKHLRTWRAWQAAGRIPRPIRIGRSLMWRFSELEAWVASLYKKPVILNDPKTDKPVKTKSRKWWGRFKDEHGVERRVPLAVDKAAAQSMLNELVRRTERRAAGLIDRFDEHRQRLVADHEVTR